MNVRSELQSQRKHSKIERATPVNGNLVYCVISLYLLQKELLSPDLIISLCYAKWSPTVVSIDLKQMESQYNPLLLLFFYAINSKVIQVKTPFRRGEIAKTCYFVYDGRSSLL